MPVSALRASTGMSRSRAAAWLGCGIALLTLFARSEFQALPASAEEPAPKGADTESKENDRAERLEQMLRIAADYELTDGTDREQTLARLKKPILRWSNPLRETGDGAVFLWTTAEGRPAAALSIYSYDTNVGHEFQSLAAGPLVAKYRQASVWAPKRSGLEFKPFPGEPPVPASSPALRLSQMRELTRDFTASIGRKEYRHELRLLTQPLHRYNHKEGRLLDGALFAFAEGADPELLLLVEARQRQGQSAVWQYAPARMNMGNIELKHGDAIVWEIENWNRRVDPREPYITFVHKIQP